MATANITELKNRVPANIQEAGKQVANVAGGSTVSAFFDANKGAIQAVLPRHMTPDRMMKIALRALRTTPKLMQCTVSSLFGAVVSCAQLGLEPNTPQGHISLIPFENRRKGTTEVQVIVGYKGLIDLARRSGEIVSISSHAVRSNDEFEVDFGTEESITHRPNLKEDRGDIIGFYAVAKLQGGGTQFEFMSVSEVNKIRDESQGYKTAKRFAKEGQELNTPWATSYEQMGRKTLIRRLCNYLPMSVELSTAVALDSRGEMGEAQNLDGVLDGDFHVVGDDAPDIEHDPETGELPTAQEASEPTTTVGASDNSAAALSPAAARALDHLKKARTATELESVWNAQDVEICREIGADVLAELQAKFE